MIKITTLHTNKFWKQGMDFLLQDVVKSLDNLSHINQDKDIDILIINHASLLKLEVSEWENKSIILVEDTSPYDIYCSLSTERHSNFIYCDDAPGLISNKIISFIKRIQKGVWDNSSSVNSRKRKLTDKEISIVNDLAKGIDTRIVAIMHKTTIKNVSAHKRSVMSKLNAKTTKSLLSRLVYMI